VVALDELQQDIDSFRGTKAPVVLAIRQLGFRVTFEFCDGTVHPVFY